MTDLDLILTDDKAELSINTPIGRKWCEDNLSNNPKDNPEDWLCDVCKISGFSALIIADKVLKDNVTLSVNGDIATKVNIL